MAGDMEIVWRTSPDQMAQSVAEASDRMLKRLTAELQTAGRDIEAFGRANHPWQNRTGEAESGFTVEVSGDGRSLRVYHRAEHGFWLEVKHGGRWGVIPAAVEFGAVRLQAAMDAALGELR